MKDHLNSGTSGRPRLFSDLNLLAEAQEQAVTGSNPNLGSDYDRSDFSDLSELDEGST
jgi:hypothetical protein